MFVEFGLTDDSADGRTRPVFRNDLSLAPNPESPRGVGFVATLAAGFLAAGALVDAATVGLRAEPRRDETAGFDDNSETDFTADACADVDESWARTIATIERPTIANATATTALYRIISFPDWGGLESFRVYHRPGSLFRLDKVCRFCGLRERGPGGRTSNASDDARLTNVPCQILNEMEKRNQRKLNRLRSSVMYAGRRRAFAAEVERTSLRRYPISPQKRGRYSSRPVRRWIGLTWPKRLCSGPFQLSRNRRTSCYAIRCVGRGKFFQAASEWVVFHP